MSSDQGNNGMGDIGTCPDCRFVMLRAGDSFIVDVNDWAKGIVYAADNGFQVVQEALGTIDQTTFSKAAIDYAYSKGTSSSSRAWPTRTRGTTTSRRPPT